MSEIIKGEIMVRNEAAKLREAGWTVIEEPSQFVIPFDIGFYQPDLLAHKGDEHMIVEVKKSSQFVAPEQVSQVARQVRQHPGWRFTLLTGDQVDQEGDLLTWDEIRDGINLVLPSLQIPTNQVYLLGTWRYVEAMLRRRLVERSGPMARLPLKGVINALISAGDLSPARASKLNEYLAIRNKVAHGFATPEPTPESFSEFLALSSQLLSEWASGDDLRSDP